MKKSHQRRLREILVILVIFAIVAIMSTAGHSQDLQVSYFGHAGNTAKFNNDGVTPNQSAFNSARF